ncbi:MAG: HAD family hydrolase [Ardenticatenaceae bacterium]|nr:HAD family hydrolase [Ardenticatenaceae bacterium]MCB8987196.1 HAD family hydrolase [Ardenticatenaceae bacterium]
MSIEAVVFDLGGTLIEYTGPYDAWPALETPGLQAAYDYLRAQGGQLPEFTVFRDTGFSILPGKWETAVSGHQNLRLIDFLDDILHTCAGANGIQPDWLAEAAELYQTALCSQAHPLPGAQEILTYLKSAGYKLGLLSNTMFTGAAHINDLQRFGLDGYFDAMLFSADAAKWKPQPTPYLHVLEDLGVQPARAIFIGDSPEHDIVGAHAAGMRAVLLRANQRFHLPDWLTPDATIENLLELTAVLDDWSE